MSLNTHLHALVLDGVYPITAEGAPLFHPTAAPGNEQLQTLLHKIIKRIMKLLTRLDHLIEEDGIVYLTRTESMGPDNVMAALQAASTSYRIAAGPRAARKVFTFVGGIVGCGDLREPHRSCGACCATVTPIDAVPSSPASGLLALSLCHWVRCV